MTLDADLRQRLSALAERVPVGEDPPVSRMARRGRRRSRVRRAGMAGSVAVLLATAGVIGGIVVDGGVGGAGGQALRSVAGPDQGEGYLPFRDTPALVEEHAGEEPGPGPGQGGEQGPGRISVAPRIIKTGQVTLEVPEGRFQDAFTDAQGVAERHGGFVTASGTSGTEARSGELTLRVPVSRFEAALADLKELGVIRNERVSGEDVTADFVDLQSRLRNWEAQERVLLRLMEQSTSVVDSLRVQRELQDVQLQIERIRGQLRVLRDRTDLATITVAMHERGAAPAAGNLGDAWDRALAGALDVIAAVVIGLGYLLPILVLVGLLWLAVRTLRARSTA